MLELETGFGVTPLTSGMSFFANGGYPPVGKVSVVGERGPELMVNQSVGTRVISNADSRAALDRYSPSRLLQLQPAAERHHRSRDADEQRGLH